MRGKFLGAAALMAALGVLLPGSALSNVNIHEHAEGVSEFDSRVGKVAPTSAQRAHAKGLKASVTWSKFGTPATLTRHGKFLARGIRGRTAPDAARWYLNRNRRLFGLSSLAGLRLENAHRLAGSNGYAVNFRQVFGNLEAAEGGLVVVGVTGTARKGWKVGFVSSSLTRDRALAGTAKLSGVQGWLRAAHSVGLKRLTVMNVLKRRTVSGRMRLAVGGLGDLQSVRPVAFPTVRNGVVPAYEAIVLKASEAFGFKSIVDARTGAVLARVNLVQKLNQGSLAKPKLMASEAYTYSGELAAVEGACNDHGPFAIGAGNRALDGFVAATNPLNDIVLELYKDGVLLVHADTLNSPESFHYEPAGGVPAGNYMIKICDFDGPGNVPFAEPRTYSGTLTGDATPAPPAYLARWKVFPANPPLHTVDGYPWNHPDTDTRETWCWFAAAGCDRIMGSFPLGSRGPWDHDHKLNAPTLTTRGNNAKAATSWTDPLLPSPPQFMPVSATRDYTYTWSNAWNNEQCEPTPEGGPGNSWDDSAATANLFVMHNRMHDWAYYLGFTERNWNAQDYNFGLTERRQENDPIVGNVQAGALPPAKARDNANMITLPDGQPSITNMYFWQPLAGSFYAPCVDGDYDMSVIGHEYGHMIENRMTGKGNVRSGHHAGAMGESGGDQFGVEYLFSNGFVPTSDESAAAAGPYDTGNKLRGIRNFALDLATSGDVPRPSRQLQTNTLNFSDMGYDVTGPTSTSSQQVHANGEIWSRINRNVRDLLAAKYNGAFPYDDEDLQYACANGELPAYACPGNRRWMQLYFDAMLLMPTNPSMIQARDAALSADLMRFGGVNQREMWLGYARGGIGVNATSTNSSLPPVPPPGTPLAADPDTDPNPSFESPMQSNRTVTFRARNRNGNPINARIYVGHFEARVSPIADTNPATTGSPNLDDVAPFAPGTYEFTAQAPGYGLVRFRETFSGGGSETITIRMATNWASSASGATATGDGGTTVADLIDDTENTQWTADGNTTGPLSVDGKKVTIDLGGTASINIRYVNVSAMLRSGQNRFTAVRQFELWTCDATRGGACATDAGYTRRYTSPADAFPGNSPRPVSPHLILRTFDIPDTRATHVRFVVKTSQCTGGPNFLGEQDADPANATHCPDASVPPTGPATKFVRAAEFQVFDANSSPSASGTRGGGGGGGDHDDDDDD
jgi:extracellular elastinolytic metalloproteinase